MNSVEAKRILPNGNLCEKTQIAVLLTLMAAIVNKWIGFPSSSQCSTFESSVERAFFFFLLANDFVRRAFHDGI